MSNYSVLASWAKLLYLHTKARAKKKNLEFTLGTEEFAEMLWASGFKCALTGIPFDREPPRTRHGKRPFAASIDRKESSKGYTRDNCRLVCVAANVAMNWWGEEVLWKLAAGLLSTQENRRRWHAEVVGAKCLPGVKARHGPRGIAYVAKITRSGKERHLGTFETEEKAHAAYLAAKNSDLQFPQDLAAHPEK